ncbi:cytochrome b562 [Thalassotalea fonticola]|uniref:Cytochrome b562 n=1 Tax=Thalassotalea fonticola TaxID=3065649 RepID=A0ABZ0GKJ8_9GAMM|nr:cytochrome b562 [Colwelliaceae bacterium S1-1]
MKKILLSAILSLTFINSAFAAHPQCGETELANIMGNMKDSMKAIKGAAKSNDIEKLNSVANQLLASVQKADQYVPLTITDQKQLTAEQQQKFADYKNGIAKLEQAVTALTAATNAAERKAALGQIGKAAKKGHKAFKMDCDE